MPKLSPGPGLSAQEVGAHQLARIYDAMIEIVAERGYRSLKVRDLVSRAEVSTRAFYEHFGSKEDCFLQTYRLISRRASRRIIAAQTREPDWRKRPRLVFEAFVSELEQEPAGARLALLDAYTAGEAALAQALRTERDIGGMLSEVFSREPRGVVVPPLIVQGMIAGVASVSKNRLLAGKVTDLANDRGELMDWAMCYPDPAAAELAKLDSKSVWGDTVLEPASRSKGGGRQPGTSTGDHGLVLKAVADAAAVKGYGGLTVSQVRAAAGISRKKFSAYFDDLEDCYLAAVGDRAAAAFAQAARARASAGSAPGGAYRAIAALSECIGKDPFLARVCARDDFPRTRAGLRAKKRLIDAALELPVQPDLIGPHFSQVALEASSGAVWSLFQQYVLASRDPVSMAASLVYLYLAPVIGPPATVRAIRHEQSP